MPIAGRKPNPDRSAVINRNKVAEFTEVPEVPFEDGPKLRKRATDGVSVMAVGAANSPDWPQATLDWWDDIRRMPHAALWDDTAWRFAMDCAEVHARTMEGWRGYTGAQYLAISKQLGVTADYRRDLRIKYVPAKQKAPDGDLPDNVRRIDEFRDL